MEDEVHSTHRLQNAVIAPHVSEVELHSGIFEPPPHVILLLFVPAENPNLAKANLCGHVDDGVAKGSGAGGMVGGQVEDLAWERSTGQRSDAVFPRTEQPHLVGSSQVLVASLSGSGISLVDVSLEQGEWKMAERWKSDDMRPEFPHMVVHNGHAYGFDISTFCCVDLATGNELYKQRLHGVKYRASPAYADGKIYVTSHDGHVSVIKPGPKFEQLADNTLDDYFSASPAIAGGRIYLRGWGNAPHLYAIEALTK